MTTTTAEPTVTSKTSAMSEMSPLLRQLLEQAALPSECLHALVCYAAHQGAGDLYCTAQCNGYEVSTRCDGMLHPIGDVPKAWAERLIGYTKVEARIDPSQRRHPQDGRLMVLDGKHPIDVRVSTIPTFYGQDMALRILDRRNQLYELANLGLSTGERNRVRSLIQQPHGLILVSGATGSGKSTTLYAILNDLNDGTRKINTIEDPVEFDMPGVHQSQVNLRIGLDFSDLLPAVLRQDPDVIMVGEVRDTATAITAVRAAVTGQLVLATLHASRAAGAIHSMLGLGTNPHLLAGALRGVIAQYLLRRICADCSEALDSTAELTMFDGVKDLLDPDVRPVLHQGRGCATCDMTGYHGRIALFEMLVGNPTIREMIERQARPDIIEARAIEDGMIPLRACARVAVARGATTLEEAMRVLDLQD